MSIFRFGPAQQEALVIPPCSEKTAAVAASTLIFLATAIA